MSKDDLYKKAEKRADEKISFYHFLYAFVVANVFLFIINAIFSFGHWWFYWITILTGIALLFKFLKTFVLNDKVDIDREKMIEDEMKKMKK